MRSRRLGIAIIGAGYWGNKLINEYLRLTKKRSDVRLRFVVDSKKDRLASIAMKYGLDHNVLQTNSSIVFKDDSVDAIHIAIPNDQHFSCAMSALESGKHVLLEKPMATTTLEAARIAREAKDESVVLQVGHIFRYNNAINEARILLNNNVIGKPLYYNLEWEAAVQPSQAERDIIFDLGPHPVDVLNYLSDEWPAEVMTIGGSFREPDHEAIVETVAELRDGVIAPISLSWLYAGPKKRRISITGESGAIEVDALNQRAIIYRNGVSKSHPIRPNNTIESMITDFVDCILEEKPPRSGALVGVPNVAVLSAMRESMKTRRFVKPLVGQ